MLKIVIIFLSISLNMCFGCSKEPSHGDRSFEYPQHTFWFGNKKNNFHLRTLIWGADLNLLICLSCLSGPMFDFLGLLYFIGSC